MLHKYLLRNPLPSLKVQIFIIFYSLFDVDNLTDYEKGVVARSCWSIAKDFKEEYDEQFLEMSPHTIDLSETFNNKNFFFDYIHVSSKRIRVLSNICLRNYIN